MPELPEVETIVQELTNSPIILSVIESVTIYWERTIYEDKNFEKFVTRQKILSVSRRGKYIILHLTNGYLLIHLRMSGRLVVHDKETPHSPYERVAFTLSNQKEIRFIDVRKFGRIKYTKNLNELDLKLGVEPLSSSFTYELLKNKLKLRSTSLKGLLLNQQFIAGLGNIYVDEALWLAKLNPTRKANSLSNKEAKDLFKSIQEALQAGLKSNGATLGSGKTNFYRLDGSKGRHIYELNVFRRTGKPCKRCGTPISKMVVAGRGTHVCLNCQPF